MRNSLPELRILFNAIHRECKIITNAIHSNSETNLFELAYDYQKKHNEYEIKFKAFDEMLLSIPHNSAFMAMSRNIMVNVVSKQIMAIERHDNPKYIIIDLADHGQLTMLFEDAEKMQLRVYSIVRFNKYRKKIIGVNWDLHPTKFDYETLKKPPELSEKQIEKNKQEAFVVDFINDKMTDKDEVYDGKNYKKVL